MSRLVVLTKKIFIDTERMSKQQLKPQRLKGFADQLPTTAAARWQILTTAVQQAKLAGFQTIETPTIEYYETLVEHGETNKQLYRFTDHGQRDVGLRFDLTVPFARFVAEHQGELVFPFKRLQFGNVFRGEKPQRGRFREFCQCDVDIVGADSISADCEIIHLLHTILTTLDIGSFQIAIGHRAILCALLQRIFTGTTEVNPLLIIIDKLTKLNRQQIVDLLVDKSGGSIGQAEQLLDLLSGEFAEIISFLRDDTQLAIVSERFQQTVALLQSLPAGDNITIDLSIARGLDYYTGIVFETTLSHQLGSICSGGRYDNLVSRFSTRPYPGIGGSIGVDRLVSYLQQTKHHNDLVLVALADKETRNYAFHVAQLLRRQQINTAIDVSERQLKQQLKQADRIGYPVVAIVGERERHNNTVNLRRMIDGTEQKNLPLNLLASTIITQLT